MKVEGKFTEVDRLVAMNEIIALSDFRGPRPRMLARSDKHCLWLIVGPSVHLVAAESGPNFPAPFQWCALSLAQYTSNIY